MSPLACILGDSPVRLWGITSRERLRRQLQSIGVRIVEPSAVSASDKVLLLRADYLFEARTLKALSEQDEAVLQCTQNSRRAAAVCSGARLQTTTQVLLDEATTLPAELHLIEPSDLHAFDVNLRRAETPLLEPLSEARRSKLEDQLYGNSYKGVTDLVTKWLWPRPAKHVVRACARFSITPNTVTAAGFLLMLLATVLFFHGEFITGLVAAWIMTLLDTVDGKLARVTVQSSRFGHYFDHGIDLVHPPFWYIYWGMALEGHQAFGEFAHWGIYWTLIAGYVGGRLVEGAFHLFADCSIFTWRPFDAWFRLITARRNPCLIIMTFAMLVQRPHWALIAVTAWTVATSLVLFLRLLQGALRSRAGRLSSWLADPQASRAHPLSYRTFSSTAGAYAPG
jgi:CDP-alcohol phosphatidyltransferase